jgi:hypothetical protein
MNRLTEMDPNKVRVDYMSIKDDSTMSSDDLINLELLALRYGFGNIIRGVGTVLGKTFYDAADVSVHSAVAELNKDLATVSDKFDTIVKRPVDNTI